MTAAGGAPRPSDRLLAWLSARGQASRPALDRACRALADRFDPSGGPARSPTFRYIEPLRRFGHVEAVSGGFAVVPPTICWMRRPNQGVFVGARDELLKDQLHRRLGPGFIVSRPNGAWPATWSVAGNCEAVASAIAELEVDVDVIHESGMRLLTSLPTLEDAIAKWPDVGSPSGLSTWEVAVDLARGLWRPAGGAWVDDALIRPTGGGRRVWRILRGGVSRLLDSPEKRAVAWWAEMARLVRPRIGLCRTSDRLVLPASLLPPPVMVERPLIWASGLPPELAPNRKRNYEVINSERAGEVARVLGLSLEDAK